MTAQANATLLRAQLQQAHWWLESTMQGMTDEVAHFHPGGKAHPIGSMYVHVVNSEDYFVNQVIKNSAPLMMTTFMGNTGVSEQQPMGNRDEWAGSVQVNLGQAQEYAQAVYANTDATLAQLADADLEQIVDLTAAGLGKLSFAQLLSTLLLNCYSHTGEISCIKGLQGLQGYPM